tara:strand:+ start:281 stop:535 length:255 start_codon:yes stop_codon:yes gene_type:complete
MLKENLNKSDIKKIEQIVRKEIRKQKLEAEIKKQIKNILASDYKKMKDFDPNFEDTLHEFCREFMQSYHEMFYRNKQILNKIKK